MCKFPEWIKKKIPLESTQFTRDVLKEERLNTVCASALCPNISECYSKHRATFLVMGNICTRNCAFCGVTSGRPEALDAAEPERIASAVSKLGLKHVVITSVTRDDLADGGAEHYFRVVTEVRKKHPSCTIEILTPDFQGNENALRKAGEAAPDIFNHNVETVPRLYSAIRPDADYERSLRALKFVKENFPELKTKSGMMVGLGEEAKEVLKVLRDLRAADVDLVTIGQYLRPKSSNAAVEEFVLPAVFDMYRDKALELGFLDVSAGPFVRSSYNAEELAANAAAETAAENDARAYARACHLPGTTHVGVQRGHRKPQPT